MKISSLGHACFMITTDASTSIITDPYDASIGYPLQRVEVDLAVISHGHYDHSCTDGLIGDPIKVTAPGVINFADVRITSLACYHDENKGKDRGSNLISIIEADGLRIAHFGDLGHIPSEELYDSLKDLDAVMIPVGGTFTVDAAKAKEIVDTIKPRVIIPMHYQTDRLTLGKTLDSVEKFTSRFDSKAVEASEIFELNAGDGKMGVFILPYAGQEK